MTDEGRGAGDTGGRWSVDLLADLHAGALDEETTRRLWPQASADPQARAVLQALDATRAQLAQVDTAAPAEPIPDAVAARLDAAIAGEQRAGAPRDRPGGQQAVVDMAAARHRRNRRMGWAAGVVAAAAVVAAVVAVAVPRLAGQDDRPMARPEPTLTAVPNPGNGNGPLAVSRGRLKQVAPSALGARDYGPLADRQRLAGCLAANGAGSPPDVAGIKQLRLDGKPGVLMLLTTGKAGQFRLLVVSPDCARGNPATMTDSLIGSPVPPTR